MLEIRTIIIEASRPARFDNEVNNHLKEGWELVRRDILPAFEGETVVTRQMLYAELERDVEETEDEGETDKDEPQGWADWNIVRDPTKPYKCSNCGYKSTIKWPTCPGCDKQMRSVGE